MDSKGVVLEGVNACIAALELTYAYDQFNAVPSYPYFVGSYRDVIRYPETRRTDGLMTITGFDQASSIGPLLDAEERIKAALDGMTYTDGHLTVVYDLAGGYEIPADAAMIKRIVIQVSTRTYGE